MTATKADKGSAVLVFEEINRTKIEKLWHMLGLPGEPKENGTVKSPFKDDHHASFSIHSDGLRWKDWSKGDDQSGGDSVDFVKAALRCDDAEARRWWMERSGIDSTEGRLTAKRPRPTPKPPAPEKVIQWPGDLFEGDHKLHAAFAAKRGLSFKGITVAVSSGILRFIKLPDGRACYVITDSRRKAAEIRDWNGKKFGASKAYPLSGVEKAWLPGLSIAATSPKACGILLCEGCTDHLVALDIYTRYKTQGGSNSWIPCSLLGATCKRLLPEAEEIIRGRTVRIAPDGDDAGDAMAVHWTAELTALGCAVEIVEMPRGRDLADMAAELNPSDLYA